MRLLVITNDYPPKAGGIQQYLGNLVEAYPHPVRVLAPVATSESHMLSQGIRSGRPEGYPVPTGDPWFRGGRRPPQRSPPARR